MKMTAIKLMERKNLGDYQHRELEIQATIEEGESEATALNRLAKQVRWYLNKRENEIEYNRQRKLIEGENEPPEDVLLKATNFINRYEVELKEIEGV